MTYLWRVSGVRRYPKAQFVPTVGIIPAPDPETALRVAVDRWGLLYTDLQVREPVADFPRA